MDWSALPLRRVPLWQLVWPCHDIDPAHIHPAPDLSVSTGPIHVQELIDGSLFIHDGRHRAARARLRGEATIDAFVLAG